MDIMQVIQGRRTIRKFKPDPVPDSVLGTILEAATWAPSHKNEQPWEFARVGPETRKTLLGMLQKKVDEMLASGEVPPPARPGMESLKNNFGGAQVMIAVISKPGEDQLHTQENLAATATAVQNMTLAGWSRGIGCVWLTTGSVPPARPVLQVKEGHTVVALLAMGYPDDIPPAPPREPYQDKMYDLP